MGAWKYKPADFGKLVGNVLMGSEDVPSNGGELCTPGRISLMGGLDDPLKKVQAATRAATISAAFPFSATVDPPEGLRSAHVAGRIQHNGVCCSPRIPCNIPEIWQALNDEWLHTFACPLQG